MKQACRLNRLVSSRVTTVCPSPPANDLRARKRCLCFPVTQTSIHDLKNLLDQLEHPGFWVDTTGTYLNLLRHCETAKVVENVKRVHAHIVRNGYGSRTLLGNLLVRAYGNCGDVKEARAAFESISQKNDFSWGCMLTAYAQNGHYRQVLELYHKIDLQPNAVVYATVIAACSSLEALAEGKAIHARIISTKGFRSDVVLENTLLSMYGSCGSLHDAKVVFDKMPRKTVASWNAMIAVYAQNEHCEDALELYGKMDDEHVEPNDITFTSVLGACSGLAALEQGKAIHARIVARKFQPDIALQNALLTMYAKCKCPEEAAEVFQRMRKRDVISWSAMVGAFAETGHPHRALQFYGRMQLEGIRPNKATFASILRACVCLSVGALEAGKAIHAQIVACGYETDVIVGTALADLYASHGSLDEARSVFDQIQNKDVASWTVLIAAYAQHGRKAATLELFKEMQCQKSIKPNRMIYSATLTACASLGALAEGKAIHAQLISYGMDSDVIMATALVNMYSKCGSLDDARHAFDEMSFRDTFTWTTLITGYAKHGCSEAALELYMNMELEGIDPNELTYTAVLHACNHAGLQQQGHKYFISMQGDHGIEHTVEHYGCMVDLLGRAGRLNDANELINYMPFEPSDILWTSLLGACRTHKDIQRATYAAEEVSKLDPEDPVPYVMLSNIHVATGNHAGMTRVRKAMEARGLKKRPGCSFIEIENRVHEFTVGDDSHPRNQEIFAELRRLSVQLKAAGYVPEMRNVLHDVEEQEKEYLLCLHSEKLAIAFGLISSSAGTTLRIYNTLRICSDCHAATKLISKIVQREIVIRDANRFHRFQCGVCSCGDYW